MKTWNIHAQLMFSYHSTLKNAVAHPDIYDEICFFQKCNNKLNKLQYIIDYDNV